MALEKDSRPPFVNDPLLSTQEGVDKRARAPSHNTALLRNWKITQRGPAFSNDSRLFGHTLCLEVSASFKSRCKSRLKTGSILAGQDS